MSTIQQFKTIRASVSPEVQSELYGLLIQDLDTAVQRMIEIGNENEVSFTADEISSYLQEMDAEDEFDDIQLDEAILASVSGGGRGKKCDPGGGSNNGVQDALRDNLDNAIQAVDEAGQELVNAQSRVRAAQAALSAGQQRLNEGSGNNFM